MSDGAKLRWAQCEQLAKVLGCGKTHVHDKLYSRMKREDLLEAVLDNVAETVDAVKAWPEFSEEGARLWVPKGTTAEPTAMEKLKLAGWFVSKVGGIEHAKRALAAYVRLEEELG